MSIILVWWCMRIIVGILGDGSSGCGVLLLIILCGGSIVIYLYVVCNYV